MTKKYVITVKCRLDIALECAANIYKPQHTFKQGSSI